MREGWEEPYAIDPEDPFYMTREERDLYEEETDAHREGDLESPFEQWIC